MFYKYILCSALLLSFFNCKELTQNSSENVSNETAQLQKLDNEFLINGTTFNSDNTPVYLFKNDIIIDSAQVKDNAFIFKGTSKTPELHSVSMQKDASKFIFLIDNTSIDLFLNNNLSKSTTSSNSQLQKDYVLYRNSMQGFKDRGVELYYNLKGNFSTSNIKALKKERAILFKEQHEFLTGFISSKPNSYASGLAMMQNKGNFSTNEIETLYTAFSKDLKQNETLKTIYTTAKETKTKAETSVATTTGTTPKVTPKKVEKFRPKAYAISGKNQYGQHMSLASIPKGKVILLDFWASWCGPCRATNPNLVRLHNTYKNDGLVVLNVSEDKGEAEWMNAITVDNLNWDYHIIDKNKSIAFRYGVESIPFKVLIDKQGRIAAEKISGTRLENKIKELLKE